MAKANAKKSYEEVLKHQEKTAQNNQMGQKMGNVKGKAETTGSFTKAK